MEVAKSNLVCRVCLATSRRLYSLHILSLSSTYALLTGDSLAAGPLPRVACAMCIAQLRATKRLVERCHQANQLLLRVLQDSRCITAEGVNEARGLEPKLYISNLVEVQYPSNYCDLHIKQEDSELEGKVKTEFETVVIEKIDEDGGGDDFSQGLAADDNEPTKETHALSKETLTEDQKPNWAIRVRSTSITEQNFDIDPSQPMTDDSDTENKPLVTMKGRTLSIEITPLTISRPNSSKKTVTRKRKLEDTKPRATQTSTCKTRAKTGQIKRKKREPVKRKVESEETSTESVPGKNKKESALNKSAQRDYLGFKRRIVSKERDELIKKHFIEKYLSLPEQMLELENAKLSTNYLKSPYKCEFCYKGYHAEATYNRHMERHNKNNGPHECPVCHMWMKHRRALCSHVVNHSSLFSCRACSFATHNKETAVLHERWHRGIVYNCDQCNETFARKTSLLSHVRILHPVGNRGSSCPLCGYSYITEKGVTQHLARKHAGETVPAEGPRCAVCDAMFATQEACDRHNRVAHQKCERNERPQYYRQGRDGPRWRRGVDVAKDISHRHPPTDGDTKPFACLDCEERFATRKEQRQHTRVAHGCVAPFSSDKKCNELKFQCDVCGRLFQILAQLQDHLDVHNAAATYACPDCSKTYKTRQRMLTHRKSHTARFVCPLCQRVFNCLSNRDRHYTYVHSTVRNIKCGYCEKDFKDIGSRRLHEKYVHLKTPWPKRVRTRKRAQVES